MLSPPSKRRHHFCRCAFTLPLCFHLPSWLRYRLCRCASTILRVLRHRLSPCDPLRYHVGPGQRFVYPFREQDRIVVPPRRAGDCRPSKEWHCLLDRRKPACRCGAAVFQHPRQLGHPPVGLRRNNDRTHALCWRVHLLPASDRAEATASLHRPVLNALSSAQVDLARFNRIVPHSHGVGRPFTFPAWGRRRRPVHARAAGQVPRDIPRPEFSGRLGVRLAHQHLDTDRSALCRCRCMPHSSACSQRICAGKTLCKEDTSCSCKLDGIAQTLNSLIMRAAAATRAERGK